MAKQKPGLHKEVSSIFNGVPVSKDNDGGRMDAEAIEEPMNYGPPSHLTGTATRQERPEVSTPEPEPFEERKRAPEKKVAPKAVVVEPKGPSALEQTLQRIKDKLFTPKPGVSPGRQKAMVVLMPVMFIGMVVAFYKVLGVGPGKSAPPREIKPSGKIAAASNKVVWKIPEPYPTTLRDPMKFGTVTTTTTDSNPGNLDIKGIVYSEDNPSAVIGTEIVHEGETVSGATIVKINKSSIEFEMNGKKWTQQVQP
jgi:hypothetical protein